MRILVRLILLALLAGAAFAGWMAWFAASPVPLRASPLAFEIQPGLSLRGAATAMAEAGVGFRPWQFSLLGRWSGQANGIKAGSYEVETGITPRQLLEKLTRGDVTQAEIVFVEGRTFRQLRTALDADAHVRHDTQGLTDAEVLARIGAVEPHPEGLFFPDTYLFAKQSSDLAILRRAYQAMQRHLAVAWAGRDASVPFATPYQALIMASIVEKETSQPADRPLVASVFANRLRIGMPLQTDPTVIYGLGDRYTGKLTRAHLKEPTPYNTYVIPGLPPTPIAMVGREAIHAALNPVGGTSLYFVARGDGSHVFSDDLDAHNNAVREFQLKRRADYRSSPAPATTPEAAPAAEESIPAASPNTAPESLPQVPTEESAPTPDADAPQNTQ